MTQLSWTLPVTATSGSDRISLDRRQVWEGLVHKAEHPSPYVPAVTACKVLERHEDGFLREITVRDEVLVQERVTFLPEERVVFRPVNDPCIEEIVNAIGEDEHGGTTLSLLVTLSPEGVSKAERTRYFLHETQRYFSDALQFIVEGLVERHTASSRA
ncbi:MAG TPA: SRPBCC family protein [Streptomyces sp.]|nr:SRPBCC family protein [Streptomyces sp.]